MGAVRGAIVHPDRAAQLRDFSGLRFGKITPSDMDAYIEYQDKCYVYMEFKYGAAEMPYGQRLALERMCFDMNKVKPTIGILARHWQPAVEPIDCANASVVEVYEGGRWRMPAAPSTVRETVEHFLEHLRLLDTLYNELVPPTGTVAQLKALASSTDWARGLRCGITGQACRLCKGVPCHNSTPITP